ncbi:hypothetical protein DT076_16765 [Desertihabitans brevis]|uniref:Uncharacterized protein n=1 Tax=Desertihabitans brevis TaxID=2268447 RepID=A0A367YRX3_9ACTN|nr:hypothetical protein [Desertihabitans brevis]RCK68299.1 hypothetical protein DT076_16765 [Desertihabitans brevis]
MGQRQKDKEWPAPRNTRHVWILGSGPHGAPVQGLVIAWHRHAYRWQALCCWVEPTEDGGEQLVQRWLPVERLRPARTDPNQAIRYSWFSERLRPSR